MKKIVCERCGSLVGFKFEEGDPGYIGRDVGTLRFKVGDVELPSINVKDLKKELTSTTATCPNCGLQIHMEPIKET